MTLQLLAFGGALNQIENDIQNFCCISSSLLMLIGICAMLLSSAKRKRQWEWQNQNQTNDDTPDDSPYGK